MDKKIRKLALAYLIIGIFGLVANIAVWVKDGFMFRHYFFTPMNIILIVIALIVLIIPKKVEN